jgi:dephospho-CoA kinase
LRGVDILDVQLNGRVYQGNIAIHGRAYSGKDTVASYLMERYGYKKIAFADPIYWIARKVFRMKRKNRRLLQIIGQGARLIYPDIWVIIAMYRAKRLSKQGYKVLLSDVRQANEYEKAVKNGFLVIHVDADLDVRMKRCRERDGIEPQPELWENPCETGADKYIPYMIKIKNNKGFDELYKQIDEIMGRYGFCET